MRTLIYDIETSPNLGYVWGKWQQDVIEYKEEWHILCFAYKWLGQPNTHVIALPDFPRYKTDPTNDFEVVRTLHELFSEADVVVAHNGNSFDQKKAQARMLVHGMSPPEPYKQIDTKLVARRYFNFNSNKLDDLGIALGEGQKLETGGFTTWLGCMAGEKKSWAKMKKYNKQDVVLLEKIYLRMRPWIQNHPGANVVDEKIEGCPKCGKGPLISRGYAHTNTSVYQRFRCSNCGGWSRQRKQENKTKVRFVN